MSRRKKPDLLATLAAIAGIGVIVSSLSNDISSHSPETRASQISDARPVLQSIAPATNNRP